MTIIISRLVEYSRELDEFDVLGVDRNKPVTEADILQATSQTHPVRLVSGSTILVVQSGAMFPDGPMVTALNKSFNVVPFTGISGGQDQSAWQENQSRNLAVMSDPDRSVTFVPLRTIARSRYKTEAPKPDAAAYSRLLRLAAARAGASVVVCYWGILESGNEEMATKTVSWMPVLNWVVPDEKQHMRIRLKIAVVDVATGSWSVFSTQPEETKTWSVRARREVADQKQVEALKGSAYEAGARELVQRYSSPSQVRN